MLLQLRIVEDRGAEARTHGAGPSSPPVLCGTAAQWRDLEKREGRPNVMELQRAITTSVRRFPACSSAAKLVGAAAQRCELGERGRRTEGSSAAMGRRERRRGVGASGEELAKDLSAAAAANPVSGWRRVGKMTGNCVCLGFFF